jgi:hypothetical protein
MKDTLLPVAGGRWVGRWGETRRAAIGSAVKRKGCGFESYLRSY